MMLFNGPFPINRKIRRTKKFEFKIYFKETLPNFMVIGPVNNEIGIRQKPLIRIPGKALIESSSSSPKSYSSL